MVLPQQEQRSIQRWACLHNVYWQGFQTKSSNQGYLHKKAKLWEKKLDTMRNLRINTNFWGTKNPSKFQISWSRQVFTFKPRKTCLPPCSSNITTVLIPTSLLWRREHITTRYWQEPQRRFQTGCYCTYGNRFKDVCCRRHAAIHWAPAHFFKFFLF